MNYARIRPFNTALCILLISLAGCGGGGGGGGSASTDTSNTGNTGNTGSTGDTDTAVVPAVCSQEGDGVNTEALLTEDCPLLSHYRLFASATNPTTNAMGKSLPYSLATELFTDYASKYRFVILPTGEKAEYREDESFNFPVGTVITKTFAMPVRTDTRGFSQERLLETRLLIRRASGWVALPYVWDSAETKATLNKAGADISITLTHQNTSSTFTYKVPTGSQCVQCHQLKETGDSIAKITPIGPKARHINTTYSYESGSKNQLIQWVESGVLKDLGGNELTDIKVSPTFNDSTVIAGKTSDEIHQLAKGYLDINCAHCHRDGGSGSNYGLKLEFGRDFMTNLSSHGILKTPVAYSGNDDSGLIYDVVPGDAAKSIMPFRMNSNDSKHRMPEVGRAIVHQEGVALITQWINNMDANLGK